MKVPLAYGGMVSYMPCTSLFTAEPTQFNGPMTIGSLPEGLPLLPYPDTESMNIVLK